MIGGVNALVMRITPQEENTLRKRILKAQTPQTILKQEVGPEAWSKIGALEERQRSNENKLETENQKLTERVRVLTQEFNKVVEQRYDAQARRALSEALRIEAELRQKMLMQEQELVEVRWQLAELEARIDTCPALPHRGDIQARKKVQGSNLKLPVIGKVISDMATAITHSGEKLVFPVD